MSIFGTIMSKIFGTDTAQAAASAPGSAPSVSAPKANDASTTSSPNQTPTGAAPSGSAPSTAPSSVDVAQVLDGMEANAGEKLDWRHSIVDLMKLLHMDSSHANRKQLAEELHFSGNMNDSASMNMWLHKEVMKKLAENGGKLPADLH